MRGRRPKPTSLKLIEGNPGKRPLDRNEPRPSPGVPTCPAHLNPSAKAEWKRLARQMLTLGMITDLDRSVLAKFMAELGLSPVVRTRVEVRPTGPKPWKDHGYEALFNRGS